MKGIRKIVISVFVIFWILLFHYESLRAFYLTPAMGQSLPKFPLLFPPAGWIMFYQVGNSWGTAEVYGWREGHPPEKIDPHRIFETRFVWFDNIHRNIMVHLLDRRKAYQVCMMLRRKMPEYSSFMVLHTGYPEVAPVEKQKKFTRLMYRC